MDELVKKKLIQYIEKNIEECGEPDSCYRPIAYGTMIGLRLVLDYVNSIPSKDITHGVWLELTVPPHWIYCSECNKVYVLDKDLIGKMCTDAEFCPHCGAIMDGKVD